jgi:hypothetical protein
MMTKTTTEFYHKELAVNCFNAVWDLIDLKVRTKEEDEKMIHLAHTSFWHWTEVEGHTAKNLSIGYWQLSRVYATAGLGERSLYYAERCLSVSLEGKIETFYIGYAYETLSRAHALLGDYDRSIELTEKAMDYAKEIVDEGSKEMLIKDLQEIEIIRN